ncbi:MAG: hypothetical protein HY089_11180 [Ignavibacteriales bacterium]|nr:hypothetical protein [Ignavibacteriales bacterium]
MTQVQRVLTLYKTAQRMDLLGQPFDAMHGKRNWPKFSDSSATGLNSLQNRSTNVAKFGVKGNYSPQSAPACLGQAKALVGAYGYTPLRQNFDVAVVDALVKLQDDLFGVFGHIFKDI